jgi:hypothetical protein
MLARIFVCAYTCVGDSVLHACFRKDSSDAQRNVSKLLCVCIYIHVNIYIYIYIYIGTHGYKTQDMSDGRLLPYMPFNMPLEVKCTRNIGRYVCCLCMYICKYIYIYIYSH